MALDLFDLGVDGVLELARLEEFAGVHEGIRWDGRRAAGWIALEA
jgi:hypothetical protein